MTPQAPFKLKQVTTTLLNTLDERSRDVITRRFGIASGQVETLESIGQEYGITRERVRQIESQGKKSLATLTTELAPVADLFERTFAEHGGILAEAHAVVLFQSIFTQDALSASHLAFYFEILPPYQYVSRDKYFVPHWRHPKLVSPKAITVAEKARTLLKETKHPITETDLLARLRTGLGETEATLPTPHIVAHLTASKHVAQTPFGEWGLTGWPETNPRGVGDKAYTVLRRHGKPEHFTRITELINKASFDHKRANAQTVHNELIKDERFVLVGRGLYGLAEWGYIPGTVADVLESLLTRARKPLSREELIEQVLAQRQVKKNTILLGLQNEERFVKTPENRYTLKEKS